MKLIKGKSSDKFMLNMEGIGYITTYESTLPYKLSLKNCQSIELGYDLDDKISEHLEKNHIEASTKRVQVIKELILEILGDKKFTEDDLKKSWSEGYHRKVEEINGGKLNYFDDLIQSLQQTEWDVEIITENVCGRCYSNNTDECWSAKECSDGKYDYSKPLLDADGCLILKRI